MVKVKVLIADDHPLIRQGLIKVISLDPQIEVVGEAIDGEDAVQKAFSLRPDVILMDLNMPKLCGVEAAKIIKKNKPEIHVIALTVEDSEQKIMEVINAGVRGYILKDIEPEALSSTIKAVFDGETVIHPKIAAKLFRELERLTEYPGKEFVSCAKEDSQLTPREIEILQYIAQGLHNKEIANLLFISEKTVKNHISSIYRKLEVEDRTQAALSAIKLKLVSM